MEWGRDVGSRKVGICQPANELQGAAAAVTGCGARWHAQLSPCAGEVRLLAILPGLHCTMRLTIWVVHAQQVCDQPVVIGRHTHQHIGDDD